MSTDKPIVEYTWSEYERDCARAALEDRDKMHEEHIQNYKRELLRLTAKLAIAKEALEFYAKNHGLKINHKTNTFVSVDCDDSKDFHGSRARAVLAKLAGDE